MTSKKAASSKRTNVPREVRRTEDFLSDWERLLLYRLDGASAKEAITFARVGSHADLSK